MLGRFLLQHPAMRSSTLALFASVLLLGCAPDDVDDAQHHLDDRAQQVVPLMPVGDAVEDRLHGLPGGTFQISVLDTQYEDATVGTGLQVTE